MISHVGHPFSPIGVGTFCFRLSCFSAFWRRTQDVECICLGHASDQKHTALVHRWPHICTCACCWSNVWGIAVFRSVLLIVRFFAFFSWACFSIIGFPHRYDRILVHLWENLQVVAFCAALAWDLVNVTPTNTL